MVRQLCRCWRRQGPVPLGIELTETLHILMIPSCIRIGKRDAVFYTISLYELKKQSANILLRRNNVVPQIRTTYHSIYWINKSKSNRPYKLMMANKCGIIEVCGTNSGYDILSFVCSNDAVIVIKMTHGDNSRLLFSMISAKETHALRKLLHHLPLIRWRLQILFYMLSSIANF